MRQGRKCYAVKQWLVVLTLVVPGISVTQPSVAQEIAEKPPHPCEAVESFHDFDFWIGEWDVETAAGQHAGVNRISRRERGCVLLEEWTSSNGGTGMSLNYYDPGTDLWKQTWLNGGAYLIEIEGGLNEAGQMALSGRIVYYGPGTESAFRGTWTPLDDGRVRQYFEQYDDEGETWAPWFDGYYVRKSGTSE